MRLALLATSLALLASACENRVTAMTNGEQVFQTACARCHGPDGRGDPVEKVRLGVPDMTDPAWQEARSDEDIARTVRQGSTSKKMPPFGLAIRGEQLAAVIRHVRSLRR